MNQTEEDVIVLNVSTDTSGKTVVVTNQASQNVIVVSPVAASIAAAGGGGGTGPQGPQGDEGALGLSAYQVWLGENNNGTEQDFLDSLVGAQGPQGLQGPPGNDGESETLSSAINVFLPNGGNFGKFSNASGSNQILVGDGTKTALDIIREALVELGQIGQVTLSANPGPSTIGFSTIALPSTSVTLTASVPNTNHSAPTASTVTFDFFKKVGSTSSYGSAFDTVSGVSGSTASTTAPSTISFSFASETPTNEWIYFKVVATDSQNSSTSEAEISFTPQYTAPSIKKKSDNSDGIDIKRVSDPSGGGDEDTNRTRFNGETNVEFKVFRPNSGVPLDTARVYYDNGTGYTAVGTVDLSQESVINDYTAAITVNHDAGFVDFGDTNSYRVKIWDDQRPYNNSDSSPHCDQEQLGYEVNRIPIKMILSSTELDNNDSDSDWQNLFDGTTSGTSVQVNEQLTDTGDFLDANTDELFAVFTVPSTQEIGDYIYWFVPTYYFSASNGGTQDITGTSNAFIDLFHNYNGSANSPGGLSNVIEDPGVLDTDYTLFKTNISLQTQFGNSSNTTPYIAFRIKDALGGTGLRNTQILIRNNE